MLLSISSSVAATIQSDGPSWDRSEAGLAPASLLRCRAAEAFRGRGLPGVVVSMRR